VVSGSNQQSRPSGLIAGEGGGIIKERSFEEEHSLENVIKSYAAYGRQEEVGQLLDLVARLRAKNLGSVGSSTRQKKPRRIGRNGAK
jgi:hypothetical protein